MRRIAIAVSVLAAIAVGFLSVMPESLAMRMIPPWNDGSASVTYAPIAHHTGPSSWPVWLIVSVGVLLVATAAALAMTARYRPIPNPAAR